MRQDPIQLGIVYKGVVSKGKRFELWEVNLAEIKSWVESKGYIGVERKVLEVRCCRLQVE